MSCKYKVIRSKKNIKFWYCKVLKKECKKDSCVSCKHKEYKQFKKMKQTEIKKHTKPSKRTKATAITQDIKDVVWKRDGEKCVICGKPVSKSCANAHYKKRSQGGLGIEENIVTLCVQCHHEEDNGLNTKKYENFIKNYLKNYYGASWIEEDLKYKKYTEE